MRAPKGRLWTLIHRKGGGTCLGRAVSVLSWTSPPKPSSSFSFRGEDWGDAFVGEEGGEEEITA